MLWQQASPAAELTLTSGGGWRQRKRLERTLAHSRRTDRCPRGVNQI
jgi:hypothetical protein